MYNTERVVRKSFGKKDKWWWVDEEHWSGMDDYYYIYIHAQSPLLTFVRVRPLLSTGLKPTLQTALSSEQNSSRQV